MIDPALEVLENRLLLTPTLVFAAQPSNAFAGHGLTFTRDAVIQASTAATLHPRHHFEPPSTL
jgi:hypothetical protein